MKGDCSHPPLNDDVSNDCCYDFSDFHIEDEYHDMHANNDSPIRPKWARKTIQEAGDLDGDLLDSRKARSQVHNTLSICI